MLNSLSLDLIIVLVYLAITLYVGIYFGRNIKNISEYTVGNRKFPTTVLVMTISATLISGSGMANGVTETFRSGLGYTLSKIGLVICCLLYAYLIAPRMGAFLGKITSGEIMEEIYGRTGRIITGFLSLIVCTGLIAGQTKAMGAFFSYFLGVDYIYALVISSLIVVIYSAFGGIKSVTFTDVLQFITLIIAVPMMYLVIYNFAEGYDAIGPKLQPYHLDLFHEKANFNKYFAVFLFSIMPNLTPVVAQRMLMSQNIQQIQTAFKISAIMICFIAILASALGLVAYAIDPDMDPNNALFLIIDQYLPAGVKGIAIIGIIAIIMSTADSYMNAGSVSFVHDFLRFVVRKPFSLKSELLYSKIITVVIGIASIILALSFKTILDLVLFMMSFYSPLVGVPMLLGIFGFRSGTKPLLAGITASLITTFVWYAFDLEKILGFGNLVPSMVINIVALLSTHYLIGQKGGWIKSIT